MIDALGTKLPPEVASLVLRFLRHPTAELMNTHIEKYADRRERWENMCTKYQHKQWASNFTFPVSIFKERALRQKRKATLKGRPCLSDSHGPESSRSRQ